MFNRVMEWLVDGIRLRLVGPTLLQDIELVPLGVTNADATRLYGRCVEEEIAEEFPESRCYTYEPTQYHRIDVWEWKSTVHAVVYFSANGDPELDLKTIRDAYGEKQDWMTINEGYNYRRVDGNVQLWCSAMPAIGVGTEEYMRAKAQFKQSTNNDMTERDDARESPN